MVDLLLVILFAVSTSDCTDRDFQIGICGSLNDDGATLDGLYTGPGDTTYDLEGGGGDGEASGPPCDAVRFGDCQFWISSPEAPAVTMADVAHFAPSVGAHVMEPAGWSATGLPANFFATTARQTLDGTVLGTPAQVRFTPVAWRWDYGDGSTTTSSSGGASWASLGLPEFAATATSHIFARDGSSVVTLTVDFAAEYRVGAGEWRSIPGILPRPMPPLRVLTRDARTLLVDEDCAANPQGPGC